MTDRECDQALQKCCIGWKPNLDYILFLNMLSIVNFSLSKSKFGKLHSVDFAYLKSNTGQTRDNLETMSFLAFPYVLP